MKAKTYQAAALKTWRTDLTHRERIANAALGISGEAGEIAEMVKKLLYHDKPFHDVEMLLELGDLLFYVAAAAHEIGYTLDEVMQANVEKLAKRHPQGVFDPAYHSRSTGYVGSEEVAEVAE